jgi:hypothetical protein
MKHCGKLASCDAVLVFNDVNVRNVEKENSTDWIHTRILQDKSYNRRIAAADSADQKLMKLYRREMLTDKLHERS